MRFALLIVFLLLVATLPDAPAASGDCTNTVPLNDCIENAIELTSRSLDIRTSTMGATTEPFESGGCHISATVWWKFTAYANSTAQLWVYDTPPGAAGAYEMQSDGTLKTLACAYDGQPKWATFSCVAGRTYYIQGGTDTAHGGTGGMDRWWLSGNVCQIAPEPPAAPSLSLSATAERGELRLDWTVPQEKGSPITGYRVSMQTACSGATSVVATLPADQTTFLASVAEGQPHCFQVAATSDAGIGASGSAGGVPRGIATTLPVPFLDIVPSGLKASWGVFRIDGDVWYFHDGHSHVSTWRIYGADAAGGPFELLAEKNVAIANRSHTEDLGPRVTRHYHMVAVNEYGEGRPTILSGTSGALPEAPTDVTIYRMSNSLFLGTRITWNAPSDTGGLPLDRYDVYVGPRGGEMTYHGSTSPHQRQYDGFSSASVGPTDVVVRAVNAMGAGDGSVPVCAQFVPVPPPASPCTMPGLWLVTPWGSGPFS